MRRYALIAAVLLMPVAALADDTPNIVAPEPGAAPQTATTNDFPAAPPPRPAQPTHWLLDLDQSDLQTLNSCVMELKKRDADPFIAKITAKLKPQP